MNSNSVHSTTVLTIQVSHFHSVLSARQHVNTETASKAAFTLRAVLRGTALLQAAQYCAALRSTAQYAAQYCAALRHNMFMFIYAN